MEILKENWFIIVFILGVVFSLGGYAVMIGILRRNVNILFDRNRESECKVNSFEVKQARIDEKIENLTFMVSEQKDLMLGILKEMRRRNGSGEVS